MAASEEKTEKVYLIKISIYQCIVIIISLTSTLCLTRKSQFPYSNFMEMILKRKQTFYNQSNIF